MSKDTRELVLNHRDYARYCKVEKITLLVAHDTNATDDALSDVLETIRKHESHINIIDYDGKDIVLVTDSDGATPSDIKIDKL